MFQEDVQECLPFRLGLFSPFGMTTQPNGGKILRTHISLQLRHQGEFKSG